MKYWFPAYFYFFRFLASFFLELAVQFLHQSSNLSILLNQNLAVRIYFPALIQLFKFPLSLTNNKLPNNSET